MWRVRLIDAAYMQLDDIGVDTKSVPTPLNRGFFCDTDLIFIVTTTRARQSTLPPSLPLNSLAV